jgi:sterol desaturase/sphingolipid hydroxylase (fatty acid hydroxylase superfamily)
VIPQTTLIEQWLLLVETPVYIAFILGEMVLSAVQHTHTYTIKDTLTNLMCTGLNLGLDVLMRGFALAALTLAFGFAPFQISNPVLYWFLLFMGQDFLYYLLHLVDHYSRFFWAVHVTHHSSERFNFTVAIRSSVFQPLYRFVYYLPLAFCGFQPLDIMLMYALCQTYGFFVHTEKVGKLGFLEWFLVTPSHHRVHHARNPIYLDKNMGMVLIIWDRIFGTFQEETEKPEYGLTSPLKTGSPREVVFGEWEKLVADLKKPLPWSLKWQYIWKPPGWSHDKSTLTSNEIRASLGLADSTSPSGKN